MPADVPAVVDDVFVVASDAPVLVSPSNQVDSLLPEASSPQRLSDLDTGYFSSFGLYEGSCDHLETDYGRKYSDDTEVFDDLADAQIPVDISVAVSCSEGQNAVPGRSKQLETNNEEQLLSSMHACWESNSVPHDKTVQLNEQRDTLPDTSLSGDSGKLWQNMSSANATGSDVLTTAQAEADGLNEVAGKYTTVQLLLDMNRQRAGLGGTEDNSLDHSILGHQSPTCFDNEDLASLATKYSVINECLQLGNVALKESTATSNNVDAVLQQPQTIVVVASADVAGTTSPVTDYSVAVSLGDQVPKDASLETDDDEQSAENVLAVSYYTEKSISNGRKRDELGSMYMAAEDAHRYPVYCRLRDVETGVFNTYPYAGDQAASMNGGISQVVMPDELKQVQRNIRDADENKADGTDVCYATVAAQNLNPIITSDTELLDKDVSMVSGKSEVVQEINRSGMSPVTHHDTNLQSLQLNGQHTITITATDDSHAVDEFSISVGNLHEAQDNYREKVPTYDSRSRSELCVLHYSSLASLCDVESGKMLAHYMSPHRVPDVSSTALPLSASATSSELKNVKHRKVLELATADYSHDSQELSGEDLCDAAAFDDDSRSDGFTVVETKKHKRQRRKQDPEDLATQNLSLPRNSASLNESHATTVQSVDTDREEPSSLSATEESTFAQGLMYDAGTEECLRQNTLSECAGVVSEQPQIIPFVGDIAPASLMDLGMETVPVAEAVVTEKAVTGMVPGRDGEQKSEPIEAQLDVVVPLGTEAADQLVGVTEQETVAEVGPKLADQLPAGDVVLADMETLPVIIAEDGDKNRDAETPTKAAEYEIREPVESDIRPTAYDVATLQEKAVTNGVRGLQTEDTDVPEVALLKQRVKMASDETVRVERLMTIAPRSVVRITEDPCTEITNKDIASVADSHEPSIITESLTQVVNEPCVSTEPLEAAFEFDPALTENEANLLANPPREKNEEETTDIAEHMLNIKTEMEAESETTVAVKTTAQVDEHDAAVLVTGVTEMEVEPKFAVAAVLQVEGDHEAHAIDASKMNQKEVCKTINSLVEMSKNTDAEQTLCEAKIAKVTCMPYDEVKAEKSVANYTSLSALGDVESGEVYNKLKMSRFLHEWSAENVDDIVAYIVGSEAKKCRRKHKRVKRASESEVSKVKAAEGDSETMAVSILHAKSEENISFLEEQSDKLDAVASDDEEQIIEEAEDDTSDESFTVFESKKHRRQRLRQDADEMWAQYLEDIDADDPVTEQSFTESLCGPAYNDGETVLESLSDTSDTKRVDVAAETMKVLNESGTEVTPVISSEAFEPERDALEAASTDVSGEGEPIGELVFRQDHVAEVVSSAEDACVHPAAEPVIESGDESVPQQSLLEVVRHATVAETVQHGSVPTKTAECVRDGRLEPTVPASDKRDADGIHNRLYSDVARGKDDVGIVAETARETLTSPSVEISLGIDVDVPFEAMEASSAELPAELVEDIRLKDMLDMGHQLSAEVPVSFSVPSGPETSYDILPDDAEEIVDRCVEDVHPEFLLEIAASRDINWSVAENMEEFREQTRELPFTTPSVDFHPTQPAVEQQQQPSNEGSVTISVLKSDVEESAVLPSVELPSAELPPSASDVQLLTSCHYHLRAEAEPSATEPGVESQDLLCRSGVCDDRVVSGASVEPPHQLPDAENLESSAIHSVAETPVEPAVKLPELHSTEHGLLEPGVLLPTTEGASEILSYASDAESTKEQPMELPVAAIVPVLGYETVAEDHSVDDLFSEDARAVNIRSDSTPFSGTVAEIESLDLINSNDGAVSEAIVESCSQLLDAEYLESSALRLLSETSVAPVVELPEHQSTEHGLLEPGVPLPVAEAAFDSVSYASDAESSREPLVELPVAANVPVLGYEAVTEDQYVDNLFSEGSVAVQMRSESTLATGTIIENEVDKLIADSRPVIAKTPTVSDNVDAEKKSAVSSAERFIAEILPYYYAALAVLRDIERGTIQLPRDQSSHTADKKPVKTSRGTINASYTDGFTASHDDQKIEESAAEKRGLPEHISKDNSQPYELAVSLSDLITERSADVFSEAVHPAGGKCLQSGLHTDSTVHIGSTFLPAHNHADIVTSQCHYQSLRLLHSVENGNVPLSSLHVAATVATEPDILSMEQFKDGSVDDNFVWSEAEPDGRAASQMHDTPKDNLSDDDVVSLVCAEHHEPVPVSKLATLEDSTPVAPLPEDNDTTSGGAKDFSGVGDESQFIIARHQPQAFAPEQVWPLLTGDTQMSMSADMVEAKHELSDVLVSDDHTDVNSKHDHFTRSSDLTDEEPALELPVHGADHVIEVDSKGSRPPSESSVQSRCDDGTTSYMDNLTAVDDSVQCPESLPMETISDDRTKGLEFVTGVHDDLPFQRQIMCSGDLSTKQDATTNASGSSEQLMWDENTDMPASSESKSSAVLAKSGDEVKKKRKKRKKKPKSQIDDSAHVEDLPNSNDQPSADQSNIVSETCIPAAVEAESVDDRGDQNAAVLFEAAEASAPIEAASSSPGKKKKRRKKSKSQKGDLTHSEALPSCSDLLSVNQSNAVSESGFPVSEEDLSKCTEEAQNTTTITPGAPDGSDSSSPKKKRKRKRTKRAGQAAIAEAEVVSEFTDAATNEAQCGILGEVEVDGHTAEEEKFVNLSDASSETVMQQDEVETFKEQDAADNCAVNGNSRSALPTHPVSCSQTVGLPSTDTGVGFRLPDKTVNAEESVPNVDTTAKQNEEYDAVEKPVDLSSPAVDVGVSDSAFSTKRTKRKNRKKRKSKLSSVESPGDPVTGTDVDKSSDNKGLEENCERQEIEVAAVNDDIMTESLEEDTVITEQASEILFVDDSREVPKPPSFQLSTAVSETASKKKKKRKRKKKPSKVVSPCAAVDLDSDFVTECLPEAKDDLSDKDEITYELSVSRFASKSAAPDLSAVALGVTARELDTLNLILPISSDEEQTAADNQFKSGTDELLMDESQLRVSGPTTELACSTPEPASSKKGRKKRKRKRQKKISQKATTSDAEAGTDVYSLLTRIIAICSETKDSPPADSGKQQTSFPKPEKHDTGAQAPKAARKPRRYQRSKPIRLPPVVVEQTAACEPMSSGADNTQLVASMSPTHALHTTDTQYSEISRRSQFADETKSEIIESLRFPETPSQLVSTESAVNLYVADESDEMQNVENTETVIAWTALAPKTSDPSSFPYSRSLPDSVLNHASECDVPESDAPATQNTESTVVGSDFVTIGHSYSAQTEPREECRNDEPEQTFGEVQDGDVIDRTSQVNIAGCLSSDVFTVISDDTNVVEADDTVTPCSPEPIDDVLDDVIKPIADVTNSQQVPDVDDGVAVADQYSNRSWFDGDGVLQAPSSCCETSSVDSEVERIFAGHGAAAEDGRDDSSAVEEEVYSGYLGKDVEDDGLALEDGDVVVTEYFDVEIIEETETITVLDNDDDLLLSAPDRHCPNAGDTLPGSKYIISSIPSSCASESGLVNKPAEDSVQLPPYSFKIHENEKDKYRLTGLSSDVNGEGTKAPVVNVKDYPAQMFCPPSFSSYSASGDRPTFHWLSTPEEPAASASDAGVLGSRRLSRKRQHPDQDTSSSDSGDDRRSSGSQFVIAQHQPTFAADTIAPDPIWPFLTSDTQRPTYDDETETFADAFFSEQKSPTESQIAAQPWHNVAVEVPTDLDVDDGLNLVRRETTGSLQEEELSGDSLNDTDNAVVGGFFREPKTAFRDSVSSVPTQGSCGDTWESCSTDSLDFLSRIEPVIRPSEGGRSSTDYVSEDSLAEANLAARKHGAANDDTPITELATDTTTASTGTAGKQGNGDTGHRRVSARPKRFYGVRAKFKSPKPAAKTVRKRKLGNVVKDDVDGDDTDTDSEELE